MNEVISVDIPNVAKFQWINLDYYCIEKICMEIVSRENVCLIMAIARGTYPDAMEEIVFNLDDGACSDVIAADDGYFCSCIIRNSYYHYNAGDHERGTP